VNDQARALDALTAAGIAAAPLRDLAALWAFPAGSGDLVPLWRRLRGVHDRTGMWPLILGED
jgi:hypothetical protein